MEAADGTGDPAVAALLPEADGLKETLVELGFEPLGVCRIPPEPVANRAALGRVYAQPDLAWFLARQERGQAFELFTDGQVVAAVHGWLDGPLLDLLTIDAKGWLVNTVARPSRRPRHRFWNSVTLWLLFGGPPHTPWFGEPGGKLDLEVVDAEPAALLARHRERIAGRSVEPPTLEAVLGAVRRRSALSLQGRAAAVPSRATLLLGATVLQAGGIGLAVVAVQVGQELALVLAPLVLVAVALVWSAPLRRWLGLR